MSATPRPVALDSTLQSLSTAIQGITNGIDNQMVQRDWDEKNTKSPAYIKNKPEHLWSDRTASGNPVVINKRKAEPSSDTTLSFLPIQDLNGYDYPWYAGGGKNMFDEASFPFTENKFINANTGALQDTTGFYATADYIPCTIMAGKTIVVNKTRPSGGNSGFAFYDANQTYISGVAGSALPVTGDMTLTVPSDAKFMRFTLGPNSGGTSQVQIEFGSVSTAFTPYSNICPISGRTSAILGGCGKNCFDINYLQATGITISDGVASGTSKAFTDAFGRGMPIPFKMEGQWTISMDAYTDADVSSEGAGLSVRILYTDDTRNYVNFPNNTTSYTRFSVTSAYGKEIKCIYFTYSSKLNTWHLKNIQLEQGTTATAYEAYTKSNTINVIFPVLGENLIPDTQDTSNGFVDNYYLLSDGSMVSASSGTTYYISEYFSVKPSTQYTYKKYESPTPYVVSVCFYDNNKQYISGENFNGRTSFSVTAPSNAAYARATQSKTNPDHATFYFCEGESVPSTFVPYTSALYCGTLNLKTGVLIINRSYITYDGSTDEAWEFTTSNNLRVARIPKLPAMIAYEPDATCNMYRNVIRLTGVAVGGFYVGASYIGFQTYANNATEWKNFLSQNNLTVCCVQTPNTIQLTPHEVELIAGQNTLWTNGDNISITYMKDDKNITNVASDLSDVSNDMAQNSAEIATTNYTIGDYLILNNTFYRVIAPIQTRSQIVVGANVIKATIGAELKSANS